MNNETNNKQTITLKLTRREVVKLLVACNSLKEENAEYSEIHDRIREQLNKYEEKKD